MRFCEDCGTHLRTTKDGLWCPKCNKTIEARHVLKRRIIKKEATAIQISEESDVGYAKVARMCPKCGNGEAYRWLSRISGEHAGIRRERTVEHLRCTKCSHLWSRSS